MNKESKWQKGIQQQTTAETRNLINSESNLFSVFLFQSTSKIKAKKTGTEEVAQQVQLNLQLPHLSMENVSYVKTIKEKMGGSIR